MQRRNVRGLLMASAIAALGVLGSGSAVGQQPAQPQTKQLLSTKQALDLLAVLRSAQCTTDGPTSAVECRKTYERERVELPGCHCLSVLERIQQVAVSGSADKITIELQGLKGLTPDLFQELMKKAGVPAK